MELDLMSRRRFFKTALTAAMMLFLRELEMPPTVEAQEGGFEYPEAEFNGFPDSVKPYRVAGGTGGPDQVNVNGFGNVANMLGDPGVIGTHLWENSNDNQNGGNPSAVLISPNTQESLDGPTSQLLLPESGYMMVSGPRATIKFGDRSVTLPPADNHTWIVVIRGINEQPGDGNTRVSFSNYDQGSTLVTRFPVRPESGAFFSLEYLVENLDKAHTSGNCGGEVDGCERVSFVAIDPNDGSYTVATALFDGRTYDESTNFVKTNVPYRTSGLKTRTTNINWN